MRNNKWVAFAAGAALVAAMLLLGNASSPGQAPAAKAQVVWEYKWEIGHDRPEFDELNGPGLEGWELVTVRNAPENSVRYYFKRQKQK